MPTQPTIRGDDGALTDVLLETAPEPVVADALPVLLEATGGESADSCWVDGQLIDATARVADVVRDGSVVALGPSAAARSCFGLTSGP